MVGGVFDSSSVTTLLENELQDGQLLSLGYDDTWQDRPHDNTMVKHRFPYNYLPHENTMADGPSIHYLPHRTTAVLAGALAKATIHDLVVSGIWLESDLVVELTTLHGSTSHVLKRGQSWLPAAKLLEYDYTWRVPDEIWEDMFRLGTPTAGDLSLMFRVVTEGSRPSSIPP